MKRKRERAQLTEAHKKKIYLFAIVVALLFIAAVGYLVGKPMVDFVREPERFRAWVDSSGFMSRVIFVGMVVFQLVIALIPGEPLEMGAGYAFGAVEGTILCIIGCVIGSALVFLFVRRFGVKLVEVFFPREKIRSLRFLQDSRRLDLLTFIVFFIPGTPKDQMCIRDRKRKSSTTISSTCASSSPAARCGWGRRPSPRPTPWPTTTAPLRSSTISTPITTCSTF